MAESDGRFDKPQTVREFTAKLSVLERQVRVGAGAELGLIALGFSDLTAEFARNVPRVLVLLFVAAVVFAAMALAYAWIGLSAARVALTRPDSCDEPLLPTDAGAADQARSVRS